MAKIGLGDEVVCIVTGFRGVVTSVTEYLQGCRRMGVQPPVDKEGKIPDAYSLDEPQLKLIKASKVPVGPQETGGPIAKISSSRIRR